MLENHEKQMAHLYEVIALPPLKMALFHAVDEQLTKAALVNATRKLSAIPVLGSENVGKQSLEKIIEHLEKKKL